MLDPSKTTEPLSEDELGQVAAARAAARARFAHFAGLEGDDEPSGDVDPDNPPMTDDELAQLRPAVEVAPRLVAASLRKSGRPRIPAPELAVSIHLDSDVTVTLRSNGEGWQSQANAMLRAALDLPEDKDAAPTKSTAIGKRAVSQGRVRVRVVTAPRFETVTVDRRVVERSIAMEASEGQIREHMDVVGSDGVLVGRVDLVEAGRLGVNVGGQHHYLPRAIVDSVADRVTLSVTADEAGAWWATA